MQRILYATDHLKSAPERMASKFTKTGQISETTWETFKAYLREQLKPASIREHSRH